MKSLSISQKLLLMLVVPTLALLFFAASAVWERWSLVRGMDALSQMVDVSNAATGLVHHTQKERGMSAGYLASGGTQFVSELTAQRGETDKSLVALQRQVSDIAGSVKGQELQSSLKKMEKLIEALPGRRELVSARRISAEESTEFYTQLNKALIEVSSQAGAAVSDALLAGKIQAQVTLSQAKEQAGIERAVLNNAFAADKFEDSHHFIRYISAAAAQDAFFEAFALQAEQAYIDLLASKMTAGAVNDYRRMRTTAEQRFSTGRFGVKAEEWFRAATARIDLLNEVLERQVQELETSVEAMRSDAQRSLYLFVFVTIVAVAAAIGLAQMIGRGISGPLTRASDLAREIAQQLVATASQQSAAASETATSVSQTSTTVDEIRQTSQIAAERSHGVRESAERNSSASTEAMDAVAHGIEAMERIRSEVEAIARNILDLSEKNIQIGEIVQSVNAIAEQSNLLAVNASIEAAKAGEHGKGFSVVASEVKALAGQSKEATGQIRSILSEIQKSSNAAVMVTEQGSKRVAEGSSLIEELGRTISQLGSAIEDNMEGATQIAATANQQLTGIEQITAAMRNIEQATRDNAAGITQLEQAARQVQNVSEELNFIVSGKSVSV